MIYAGDPGSNRALGKQSQLSRRDYPIDVSPTPTLPDAVLCYQEALDCLKGGCSCFLLLSAGRAAGRADDLQLKCILLVISVDRLSSLIFEKFFYYLAPYCTMLPIAMGAG